MGLIKWFIDRFIKRDEVDEEDYLFRMGKAADSFEADENIINEKTKLKRSSVNVRDSRQRMRFVRNCCEQMIDAGKEIEQATMEYRMVTEYLNDIELIEHLPEEVRTPIDKCAEKILTLENDSRKTSKNLGRIAESQYQILEKYEDHVPDDARKMREQEEYKGKVRADLSKLESEKAVSNFKKQELSLTLESTKNMALITLAAVVLVMFLLIALQFAFEMSVLTGCVVAAFLAALAFTWEFLAFNKAKYDLKKTNAYLTQVINTQNTVKIRYVNTTNVLEYQYRKYRVNTSDELEYFWDMYMKEKKAREYIEKATSDISAEKFQLISHLRDCQVKDPSVWISQCNALIDPREMVEIRHELIGRRQALRKQIEYNTENRQRSSDEINAMVKEHPEYGQEILSIVSSYDAR